MALKKTIVLACAAAIVAALAFALWPRATHTVPMRTAMIGGKSFELLAADTESSRELGLGARDSLPEGQGMLFVFDSPGSWGIWMKDMRFPLDILWLRQDGTITTIARDIATSTYPQAFYPKTPDATYVIELNAGAASGVAEGTKVVVQ